MATLINIILKKWKIKKISDADELLLIVEIVESDVHAGLVWTKILTKSKTNKVSICRHLKFVSKPSPFTTELSPCISW